MPGGGGAIAVRAVGVSLRRGVGGGSTALDTIGGEVAWAASQRLWRGRRQGRAASVERLGSHNFVHMGGTASARRLNFLK
jgi:hypothetical protein